MWRDGAYKVWGNQKMEQLQGACEMKTPEEIKKGLKICGDAKCHDCRGCAYDGTTCDNELNNDALAYIQQLEKSHEENCTNCAFARDAAWQCQVCRWCNDKAMKIMWMQGPRKDG